MSKRIAAAGLFSKMVDQHRERCKAQDCVNLACDGTRHRNLAGKKWGEGWNANPTR